MIRRVVAILVVASLAVQTLPVRACAIAKAMTGTSCHDVGHAAPAAAAGFGLDGHAGTGGPHDTGCQCDTPKGEVDRHIAVAVHFDLFPAAGATFYMTLTAADRPALPTTTPPPDSAPAAIILPLLN
jgi:hypothetical protein